MARLSKAAVGSDTHAVTGSSGRMGVALSASQVNYRDVFLSYAAGAEIPFDVDLADFSARNGLPIRWSDA